LRGKSQTRTHGTKAEKQNNPGIEEVRASCPDEFEKPEKRERRGQAPLAERGVLGLAEAPDQPRPVQPHQPILGNDVDDDTIAKELKSEGRCVNTL